MDHVTLAEGESRGGGAGKRALEWGSQGVGGESEAHGYGALSFSPFLFDAIGTVST